MMQDIFAQADELYGLLDQELSDSRRLGCKLAEDEAAYRVALSEEILSRREGGLPATVSGDVCRGAERVAELKRERDCSEALYNASREAINVHKLRLRMLNEQINRTWFSGDQSL